MGADILDGLERFANGGYGDWSTVASKAIARIQLDAAEIIRLRGEVEQLRVQLAGCGVIAMCNTRESLAKQMPERGAYGWSVSLEECRNAVEREMALRERLESTAPAMPNGVEGLAYAQRLAVAIWSRNYREVSPQWEVCEDLMGVLSQIDNMVSGMSAADNRGAAGVDRPAPGDCSHYFPMDPRVCVRCGWDFRTGEPPTPAAVPAGEAVAVCGTCNGVGMIGGHRGQTPDSFEQWAEDCPDCTPQPADGEAVEFVAVPDDYRNQASGYRAGWTDAMNAAPVQAAPQEGEKAAATLRDALKYVGYRQDGDLSTLAERAELWMRESRVLIGSQRANIDRLKAANPSACELGADTARLDWLEANCVDVADEYGTGSQLYFGTYATAPLRTAIDRALQHRGDSQEVGRE